MCDDSDAWVINAEGGTYPNILAQLQSLHEVDRRRLHAARGGYVWGRLLLRVTDLSVLGDVHWWLRLAHHHSGEPPLTITVGDVLHGGPWEMRIEYALPGVAPVVLLPTKEG